nr:DEAD/DEAH box helicase [uncultured Arthrobacter sp.]
MQALLGGSSVLCVMPTGSGKSAIYQVPAMTLPGVAVVISPAHRAAARPGRVHQRTHR